MHSAPSGTAAAAAVLSPSPATVAAGAARRRHPLDLFRSMGRSWALVNSSSMFRRLALCMAVVGIVSEVRCGMCLKDGRAAAWICTVVLVCGSQEMHACVCVAAAAAALVRVAGAVRETATRPVVCAYHMFVHRVSRTCSCSTSSW